MSKTIYPVTVALLLSGCGDNLLDEAREAQGSVLFACQGTLVTKDFVPDEFSVRASSNSDTDWYRQYFNKEIGPSNFLEYASIPGYFEDSPERLSDRPISGNTLPYDTYAVSYFYADDEYNLHPMNMYFGSFPEPIKHNITGGVLHFPYKVYITAPEDAHYVVIKAHDSPIDWRYRSDGELIKGIKEVWFARPADDLVRTNTASNVESAEFESWSIPPLGGCHLEYAWRDDRDDLYGGADEKVWLRDDLRRLEQETVEGRLRAGVEAPSRHFSPNAPGMSKAQNPKGKHFGFPVIGFTQSEAVDALESGAIDSGWYEGKWHAPAL